MKSNENRKRYGTWYRCIKKGTRRHLHELGAVQGVAGRDVTTRQHARLQEMDDNLILLFACDLVGHVMVCRGDAGRHTVDEPGILLLVKTSHHFLVVRLLRLQLLRQFIDDLLYPLLLRKRKSFMVVLYALQRL